MQVTVKDAFSQLNSIAAQLFAKVMRYGTMSVEIYRPIKLICKLHISRNELYVGEKK
jgi:glycyl-tRNA synthetase beta subunit